MESSMPIMEVRKQLTKLPQAFAEAQGTAPVVSVTKRGKPVMALMSWEMYEAMVETLEVIGDEDLLKSLKKSIREIKAGKLISLSAVKKELGL